MKNALIRTLSLLLTCVFVLGFGLVANAAAIPGDVNSDGEITVFDVLCILKAVLNGTSPENADVNGDGRLSLVDVVRAIKLVATGETPAVGEKDSTSADIQVENGVVKDAISLNGEKVSAAVPEGVAVNDGATSLTLTVSAMDNTNGNITPGETEEAVSYDVHIEGVSEDNTVAIVVDLGAILPAGQNTGTVALYHVENGTPVKMTQVMSLAELDAHNEFYYYPATGNVYVALATFSEIAVINDTENVWDGTADHSWYTENPNATEFVIGNANQLHSFAQIVGGMAKDENGNYIYTASTGEDVYHYFTFAGKTVKLAADIDLSDAEADNNPDVVFYPIGYYNDDESYVRDGEGTNSMLRSFEGTFDGTGHTISNIYQNTWEMIGDHNWYSAQEAYYRDGMGLFGRVYGGTVKNLTVNNFTSDGEIATTGVIAAYADFGATFENIAIFNCNPRVYNIGNGGIVGCVGWYTKGETDKVVTFSNITVDNSNKISALWGTYDAACGGIVGQYYPTSGQDSANNPKNPGVHFENCHVSAIMDVYNDVCANYQYYAYRYTGMMIGSIRENVTVDGHVYPDMTGITAKDCTVHFGDWNDYYYCELVANSLASYTHDHQMSRLTQVASVDVENMKVTTLDGETTDIPSGRVNYVVVKAKDENGLWIHGDGHGYAECYHFVDGAVWNHADAGTETVNGVAGVLKEDKQLVYREFNQLFTGYGWGVTSKGLTDYEGVVNMDIKHSENEESVVKFVGLADGNCYAAGKTVTIGELFAAKADLKESLAIQSANVMVSVSPVGDTSTVKGTYAANADDWTAGTITFSGIGEATITITDYYFCAPTVIHVSLHDAVITAKVGALTGGTVTVDFYLDAAALTGTHFIVDIPEGFLLGQGSFVDIGTDSLLASASQPTKRPYEIMVLSTSNTNQKLDNAHVASLTFTVADSASDEIDIIVESTYKMDGTLPVALDTAVVVVNEQ